MTLADIFGIPTAYAQLAGAAANTQAQAQTTVTDFASLAGKIFIAIILVGIAFAVAMVVRQWVERAIQAKQGDTHRELSILYGRIAFSVILVAGAVIALIVTGMPLQWFSGALGLGLAFAVQGPVTNFIAGILVLTNDKFSIGDSIKLGEYTGKIVDITSRHTTLRGFDGAQITIPNVDVLSSTVVCYTRNPARRVDVPMSVSYDANLSVVREIMLDTARKHHLVEPTPGPSVRISELAASSINLMLRFWVDPHTTWPAAKDEITQTILARLFEAGITVPYPIQTLRVEKGNSSMLANALPYLTRDIPAARAEIAADVLATNPYLDALKELEAEKQAEAPMQMPSTPEVFSTVPTETAAAAPSAPIIEQPAAVVAEDTATTEQPAVLTGTTVAADLSDAEQPAAQLTNVVNAPQEQPTAPVMSSVPMFSAPVSTQPIFQPGVIPAQPQ